MSDNNEELKKKIEKLETEIEDLKNQLKENSKKDKKHHEELKEIQKQQHQENLTWNKIGGLGALATPATILLTLLGRYFQGNNKKNKEEGEIKENKTHDPSALTELIKDVKK
jgi:chromosome segregation ATPase